MEPLKPSKTMLVPKVEPLIDALNSPSITKLSRLATKAKPYQDISRRKKCGVYFYKFGYG